MRTGFLLLFPGCRLLFSLEGQKFLEIFMLQPILLELLHEYDLVLASND